MADERVYLYGTPDNGCKHWRACLTCPFDICIAEERVERARSEDELRFRFEAARELLGGHPDASIEDLQVVLARSGHVVSKSTAARALRQARREQGRATRDSLRRGDRKALVALLKNWTDPSRPSYTKLAQMACISIDRAKAALPELGTIQWADVLWRSHEISRQRNAKLPGSYV